MDRNEWLQARRSCITGTDISAIVGLNKWRSAMDVFMDKLGLAPEIVENEAMHWGKALEPLIAERWSRENGVPIKQGEFIKRGIYGGTPDYIATTKLLEIKTVGARSARFWGEPGTDAIPEQYLCQTQWYLNLTDMEKADVPVLIAGQEYRVYHVTRNDKLIEILTNAAEIFWNTYIVPETPPPLDASEGANTYLKSFFPTNRGNIIRATPDIQDTARDLNRIRTQMEELEKQKLELENRIKFAIGTNDGIEDSTFKATWKASKDSAKTDWEKLAKSLNVNHQLIHDFTVTKPGSRRFLFNYLGD